MDLPLAAIDGTGQIQSTSVHRSNALKDSNFELKCSRIFFQILR
jgi:hypothetical protein